MNNGLETMNEKRNLQKWAWPIEAILTSVGLALTLIITAIGWAYNVGVLETRVDQLHTHVEGQQGYQAQIIDFRNQAKTNVAHISDRKSTAISLEKEITSIRDRAQTLFSSQKDLEQIVEALQKTGVAREATQYAQDMIAQMKSSVEQDFTTLREDIRSIQQGDLTYRFSVTDAKTAKVKDGKGKDKKFLGPITNRICFLSRVKFEDLDSEGEDGICEVTQQNEQWVLLAALEKGPDAKAYCDARCLSW